MQSDAIFDPTPGVPMTVGPDVRRIVAPNPSPMTFRGTNTYLVGKKAVAVIDPGPDNDAHMQAILDCLTPSQRISHIFVTHAHLDHSQLAPRLSAHVQAPVYALGPAHVGRSDVMNGLALSGMTEGGEGVDTDFVPHRTVVDGESFSTRDWGMHVLHTPGHIGNHICLALDDYCFTADHVMGWSTSIVSPPDGDLTDFMASCDKLNARQWRRFLPGHGEVIDAPNSRLNWLISHRRKRETAIVEALNKGGHTVAQITRKVYLDTPKSLLPAAERNVLAHLIDLSQRGIATHTHQHGRNAIYYPKDVR